MGENMGGERRDRHFFLLVGNDYKERDGPSNHHSISSQSSSITWIEIFLCP